MKRWCAGGGAFGAAQAVHLWTMRFAHRPACRGQRIRVAHRAGLRPQAPQPPTTINEPVSQLWSYRGDKYSDAGGLPSRIEGPAHARCRKCAVTDGSTGKPPGFTEPMAFHCHSRGVAAVMCGSGRPGSPSSPRRATDMPDGMCTPIISRMTTLRSTLRFPALQLAASRNAEHTRALCRPFARDV